MRFIKSHGLGNDYLVLCSGEPLSSEIVARICDRHEGFGSDGILQPVPASEGRHGLRIWNPDGTQAEKSGNGLRIFARYLSDHMRAGQRLEVELIQGVATCEVHSDGMVTVEMGAPIFAPERIPTRELIWERSLSIGDTALVLCSVSVGNPHCVALFSPETELDALPWLDWGRHLEVHHFFPNRTNVQFMRPLDRRTIEIRIWERGAGPTRASGSSAVAAFSVARRMDWVEPRATVQMPGGELHVAQREDGVLLQTGPVEEVGELILRPGFLC